MKTTSSSGIAIVGYFLAIVFIIDAIKAQNAGITWLGFICFIIGCFCTLIGVAYTAEHLSQKDNGKSSKD